MSQDSKFLSLVLRHKPEEIGISLDAGGWVAVDALLTGLAAAGRALTREALLDIVAGSDKKRLSLSDDGRRIRAAQGHSIAVDLGLAPATPPEQLYHGTATRFLDAILAEGLKPGHRRQVHLSPDIATAIKVGQRHGRPVVLQVATARMHHDGHIFTRADNGVWLTDSVPAEYLAVVEPAE